MAVIWYTKGKSSERERDFIMDKICSFLNQSVSPYHAVKQVKEALKGYNVVEFSGIEPNPTFETCMEAVEVVKKENIDLMLSGKMR
jgi:alcohol dehydrogenase YqhD (iron-dependent ADH family)